MKKIIITGASGQVGNELKVLAKAKKQFDCVFFDSKSLDITDEQAIAKAFKEHQPAYFINCAAYTAVDKAESDQELAYEVNAKAVGNIAAACLTANCQFIHISSDYVYHNGLDRPLLETDLTNPKGIYAASKLQGDKVAIEVNSATIILRTSWVYSSFGNNFLKTMIRLGNERDQLGIVYDQVGVPTYARDIAAAIFSIIAKVENTQSSYGGIYNFAPQGVTCWYDYAKTIFELEGIECKVNSILSKAYPTPAQRPTYSVLNCDKIKETFGIEIPYWKDSVKACLKVLESQEKVVLN